MDNSNMQGRSRGSRSTRRNQSGSRQQRRTQSSTGGRPLRGRTDTGYRLGNKGMSFSDRRNGMLAQLNPRALALLAAALIVLILLVVLLSSCVRSCSKKNAEQEAQTVEAVNELDARVAAGASSELTSRLSVVLDRNDRFAEIAKMADQYTDDRIIQLAIDEPDAIDFVAQVPTHEKTSAPYEETVTKGTVPKLFNWDSRWGFVDYAGMPLGVTGSGPTCLAMGYMGLTGRNDKTPADIALLSEADGTNTGEEFTTAELFSREAETLGLRVDTFEPSAEEITASLYNGHPTICQIKANTLTPYPHWVIVASVNEDGTINVYDPTSVEVSSHPWSAATISSYSSSIHVLQLSEAAQQAEYDTGEGEGESEGEGNGEG